MDKQHPWPNVPGNGTVGQPAPPNGWIILIPFGVVFTSVLFLLIVFAIQKTCAGRGLRRGHGVHPGVSAWFVVATNGAETRASDKTRILLNDDLEQQEPSSLNIGIATIVSPPSPRLGEPMLDYNENVPLLPDEALDTHGKQSLRVKQLSSPKKPRRPKTLLDTWRATFVDADFDELKFSTYNSRQPPALDRLEPVQSEEPVSRPSRTDPPSFQDRLRHFNIRPSQPSGALRAAATPSPGFVVNQDLHGTQLPPARRSFLFAPTQSIDETPLREGSLVDSSDPLDDIMGWGGVSVHDGGSITFRKINERSVTSNVSLRPERGGIGYFETLYSLLGTDHAWVMAYRSAQAAAAQQAASHQAALFNASIHGPASQFWLGALFNSNPLPPTQTTQATQATQPAQAPPQPALTIDTNEEEDVVAEGRAGLVSSYDDEARQAPVATPAEPSPASLPPSFFTQRVAVDTLIPTPPSVQLLLQHPPGTDELMEVDEAASQDGQARRTTVYMPSRATLSSLLPTPGDATVQVATGLVTRPYPPFLLPGRMDSSLAYVSGNAGAYIVGVWVETATGNILKRVVDLGKAGEWVARQGDTVGVGHVPALGAVFFTVNGKRVPVNEILVEQTSQARLKLEEGKRRRDAWVEASHIVMQAHSIMSGIADSERIAELIDWIPYLVCVAAHWNWYPNVGATGPCQVLVNMGKSTNGRGVGGRDGYLWEGPLDDASEPPPPFQDAELPAELPAELSLPRDDRRKSIGHRTRASLDSAFSRIPAIFAPSRHDLPVVLDMPTNSTPQQFETIVHRGRLVTDPMPIIDAALNNQPILSEAARSILTRSFTESARTSVESRRRMVHMLNDLPPEYTRTSPRSSSEAPRPSGPTIGLDAL